MNGSNMTNKEYYALHGTLSAERIEAILDAEFFIPRAESAVSEIEEALNPFSSEDFLVGILDRVLEIKNSTRSKTTKEELTSLYACIEDLQQVVFYEMEYQKEKLNSAMSALRGA